MATQINVSLDNWVLEIIERMNMRSNNRSEIIQRLIIKGLSVEGELPQDCSDSKKLAEVSA